MNARSGVPNSLSRFLVLLALMIGMPASSSAELPPLVEDAFETMQGFVIDEWNYSMTTSSSRGRTVERHVATQPPASRWQLLAKDGHPPTRNHLADYAKVRERRERRLRERENEERKPLTSIVDTESFQLLSETVAKATYQFRLNPEDERTGMLAEQVQGLMVIDKTVPYIEFAELKNLGKVKPSTGVRLTLFQMALRSTRSQPNGAVVIESIRTKAQGRAFFVKRIDEDSVITFHDFEHPDSRDQTPPVESGSR